MWTWSLNWGEITPRIVIGSCPMTPDDLARIQAEARVSATLSLQHDECLGYWRIHYEQMETRGAALGLTMVRCPIRDFDVPDQRRRLPRAVAALARLQAQGHRTYVHCTAGLGRSPLTVLGYLTLVDGLAPEQAIGVIHAGRDGAAPAWEAYHGCRKDLVARHRWQILGRAYQLYRSGSEGGPRQHWARAEREVIRSVLLGADGQDAEP